MSDTAFRGTLLLLQNRTRRDPESYRDEFLAQLEHFKASSTTVAAQRVANPQYIAVLNYVCHVSHCFPKESREVAQIVLELLRTSKGRGIPTDLRTALTKCVMLLRSKDIVSASETFPILFMLLQERDKALRKMILSHIVSDIRRVNMPGAKNGAEVNKKAQNYLFSVMQDDDAVQARCAEMVLIDLYRRRVWCNERAVEVLSKACFSRHTTILRTALRFFLLQMPRITSIDDDNGDSDKEEQDPGRSISKLKQKLKIVKKTAHRERVLKRTMRGIKRQYSKSEREDELLAKQHVDPIRLLRDPQQFVERLQAKLQKTSERFEVRILYLNVIARVVSEHEVIHLPLYSFLERYMEPSQLHATQLLALSSMCVHRFVPPDAVEPLVRAIANHFVSDRSSPDAITVGINTIREICKRQPLAMSADLLRDLAEYKSQRGDRGVVMAARALIQLYREVYPELLPAKLRGGRAGAADIKIQPVYGSQHVYTDIPGLDLLYQTASGGVEGDAKDEEQHTSSDDDSSSSSSDDGSGEWITDTDTSVDPEDVDGEFVEVSQTDEEEVDADGDECPRLVPVTRSTLREHFDDDGEASPGKKMRLEHNGTGTLEDQDGDGGSIVLSRNEDDSSETGSSEAISIDEGSDSQMDSDEEFEEVPDGDASSTESSEGSGEDEEYVSGEEESEDEMTPSTMAAALAHAGNDWYEDITGGTDTRSQGDLSAVSSKMSTASASATRLLTDADFAKIRKLQTQHGSHLSLRGKLRERETRSKRRNDIIHGISADLSAHDIEHFTEKKRDEDKEEKAERARELRKATSKFELRKKKKSKLNSTHGEHSKRGKLFQMTKRSQRVATKLKSSVTDRASRAKEMKKKDIKFRIKRGWKA